MSKKKNQFLNERSVQYLTHRRAHSLQELSKQMLLKPMQLPIIPTKKKLGKKLKKKKQQSELSTTNLKQYLIQPLNSYSPTFRKEKEQRKTKEKEEIVSGSSIKNTGEKVQIPKFRKLEKFNRRCKNLTVAINNECKVKKIRVYGYVVFFCLWFKNYSKKFTINRRQLWQNRYFLTNRTDKLIVSMLKQLQQLDLYDTHLKTEKSAHTNTKFGKKSHQPTSNFQKMGFISLLVSQLHQTLTSTRFIDRYHEVFSFGILNQHFFVQQIYQHEQLSLIKIHKDKQYLTIDENTEISLLILRMMRAVVNWYLLSLKDNKNWNKIILSYGIGQRRLADLHRMIRMAAIYLFCLLYDIQHLATSNRTQHPYPLDNSQQQLHSQYLSRSLNEHNIEGVLEYQDAKHLLSSIPVLEKFRCYISGKLMDLVHEVYDEIKSKQHKIYQQVKSLTFDTWKPTHTRKRNATCNKLKQPAEAIFQEIRDLLSNGQPLMKTSKYALSQNYYNHLH